MRLIKGLELQRVHSERPRCLDVGSVVVDKQAFLRLKIIFAAEAFVDRG